MHRALFIFRNFGYNYPIFQNRKEKAGHATSPRGRHPFRAQGVDITRAKRTIDPFFRSKSPAERRLKLPNTVVWRRLSAENRGFHAAATPNLEAGERPDEANVVPD
jgi:hypothetical protein